MRRFSKKLRIFAKGPSENLFSNFNDSLFFDDLYECISESEMLISGTGWQTNIEFNARKIAKFKNIPSIAVIDHWTNYKKRFIFRGIEIYPDHLLVSDEYAKNIAKEIFPNIAITQLSNLFLESTAAKLKKNFSIRKNFKLPTKIIYFTEPIREKWGNSELIPEFQALKFFSEKIDLLVEKKLIAQKSHIEYINIKTHPSEDYSKYKRFIKSLNLPGELYINKYKSLESSILNAHIAFGCETQALIVAQACGLKVISSIPPWAPQCRLPHNFIIHMSKIR